MSLLAGISQQASAITAHNDDAAAHWFEPPFSRKRGTPRPLDCSNSSSTLTGTATIINGGPDFIGAATGTTAGSTAIVAQSAGFNSGMFEGSQDHSIPPGMDCAFSFMAGVSLSAAGTARITHGKGSGDPLGRFASSWGFEFESGRVRGFWKQSASEGNTEWVPLQTVNWVHKLGLLRLGRVLSFYVGGVQIGSDLTAANDWGTSYYRGMCAEVQNNADALDNRIRFGRVMFS